MSTEIELKLQLSPKSAAKSSLSPPTESQPFSPGLSSQFPFGSPLHQCWRTPSLLADLVTNDILVKTTHGVTPWRFRAVLMKIRTSIETSNPTLWQGPTLRSSLNFYTKILSTT